jgi:hypothetical protein
MLRYITAAVAVLVLLALGLHSRAGGTSAPALAAHQGAKPLVHIEPSPDGRIVTVKHTLRGSITRAALVYEMGGEERHAAVETDCQRTSDASVTDDGYATVVELTGTVPNGAKKLRLVLESETGTDVYPIEP